MCIRRPGLGATVQASGRVGWRKFGVPASGPMDAHAAAWANRLLDNPPEAPVLELSLQGARVEALSDGWFAVTGADASANVPTWRALRVRKGDAMEFRENRCGVWVYVAVDGGFAVPAVLGAASACARAGLGTIAQAGTILRRRVGGTFCLPPSVAARLAPALERRDYGSPPALRVWPAPQHGLFSRPARAAFCSQTWTVSPQSDRVGYRLLGPALAEAPGQLLSEPVRVGTIQVPENGLPIVTMRDGPTVGGYPKLGVLEPNDVSWLAQCRPGQPVRFRWCDEARSEL